MEFITFEIAKKLKEKGFNMPCMDAFNEFGCRYRNGWCEYLDKRDDEFITSKDLNEKDCLSPTISQVLRWLREKKIYVSVEVEYEDWFEYKIVQTIKGTRRTGTRVYKTYDSALLAGIECVLDHVI